MTSREKQKFTPCDNVIFEFGLFMGKLDRNRCFIIHEKTNDLKLPSDLLGIKVAKFKHPGNGDIKTALQEKCSVISDRILELGFRYKFIPESMAIRSKVWKFCEGAQGAWWERISVVDFSSVSFFKIDLDQNFNSITLNGRSYNKDGLPPADWDTVLARVQVDEQKLFYH